MEKSTIVEKLLLFGLSRQEATIYLCLLRNGALTGYEVAKLTGISRSNVYNGLAALAENGAAYIEEGTPTKYVPVDLEEFCDNFIRYLQGIQVYFAMNKPAKVEVNEGYITIEGRRHIEDKIRHMLEGTEHRIYFSASCEFLSKWKEEISSLVDRECKVVLISKEYPKFIEENEKLLSKIIFYKCLDEESIDDRIQLIIDSEYVLTGVCNGSENDNCLYSGQKNFVTVIKDAMSNEIKLIKIKKERGL